MKKINAVNGAYENREYSWLLFNTRVLDQATDRQNPLLERCKFLSIFISNLDEFIQVRLGSLINEDPGEEENKTGLTSTEQQEMIIAMLPGMYRKSEEVYKELSDELYENGLDLVASEKLSEKQNEECLKYFKASLLPRISPMVLDAKHPLFRAENLRTYLFLRLERKGRTLFGVAKLHPTADRLFKIPGGKKTHLITSEELLYRYADLAFPGFVIKSKTLCRVTRNADFDASSEEADDVYGFDFSRLIEAKVEGRTSNNVIRIEFRGNGDKELKDFIIKHMGVKKSGVFTVQHHFDYKFMFRLSDYFDYGDLQTLRYPSFKPVTPRKLLGANLIDYIKKKDILLAYPYQSMDPLIRLLEDAAKDPRVTSIKITIYRVASRSRIIDALIRAAENGKEVVALMELCARFDEENNLEKANALKDAGCTVFYGIEDYKVHSKIISITLEENGEISYITHIGTGNYNESTARQYTDLNVITADEEIGRDGSEFFRNLALLNTDGDYSALLVAPHSLKPGLIKEIDKEIEKGKDGVIRAKFNSLTDKEIIEKLIEASKSGVRVSLVIRGISCLIPGVKGETENITIKSIVGRYLEHSRIYSFGQEGEERVYISSADLMTRNLCRRVEIAAPIKEKDIKKRILHILTLCENDTAKGRQMKGDGSYAMPERGKGAINSQEQCLLEAHQL